MSQATIAENRQAVIKQLEEGFKQVQDSERFREYLQTCAKFHKYSVANTILIWMQKPEAQQVAGFHSWLKLHRYVKKGEKGIRILAPCPWKRQKEQDGETIEESGIFFKPVCVFDVSQTDGEELPTIANDLEGDDNGLYSFLLGVASDEGLTVSRLEEDNTMPGANGWYSADQKKIWVKADASNLQAAKTLAHELGHHFSNHSENRQEREERETVAESVAYIVLAHYGLDAGSYSFDYLACWSDQKIFKERLGEIQQTANKIIDSIAAFAR